ncbi:hypothetical protein KP509_1Z215600 [Ceratopteris richardii]|nr:hypothetical protein KP509_1Z215600 [Ceratopteris richardii]
MSMCLYMPSFCPSLFLDKGNVLEKSASLLPVEALFYALPYVSLQDLLMMEQVCRTSREWIREGISLWHKVHVETPLGMSKRSIGLMASLRLVDCLRITNEAVNEIVLTSSNRITADGIVTIVKDHREQWGATMPGLKALKLHNINESRSIPKPRYYHENDHSCMFKYPSIIDVQVCPKCRCVRMVYDCPREECQLKQKCRACVFCTIRCVECGICLPNEDLNEIECPEFLCLRCWFKLAKCSECNRAILRRKSGNVHEEQGSTLLCDQCSD